MGGDLDTIDDPLRHVFGGHILPAFPAVSGQMHQAVVASRPNDPALVWGWGQVHQGIVIFAPGCLIGVRPSARTLLVWVIPGQIRADHLPALPRIRGPEDHIAGMIYRIYIEGICYDRRVPVVSVLEIPGNIPKRELRVFLDRFAFPAGGNPALDDPLIAASEDDFRIIRIKGQVGAFATGHGIPVLPVDALVVGPAGDGNSRIILLPAIDKIREAIIRDDPVKLRCGLVLLGTPALSPIVRDIGASVVGVDDLHRILRVDPHIVVVPVRCWNGLKRPPTVNGSRHRRIEHIHPVRMYRVGKDLHIIPGTRYVDPVLVYLFPCSTPIVRAVHASLVPFGFQDRIHAI